MPAKLNRREFMHLKRVNCLPATLKSATGRRRFVYWETSPIAQVNGSSGMQIKK